MSKTEKDFLMSEGYRTRISFKETPDVENAKILKRKTTTISVDNDNIKGIKYLVEHDGEKKEFFTSSLKLIQSLVNVENGEIVDIHYKKYKDGQQWKATYEVEKHEGKPKKKVKKTKSNNAPAPDDDVPEAQEFDDEDEEEINIEDIPF